MLNNLTIIGCGGHARNIADIVLNNNQKIDLVFIDENAKLNEKILNFEVKKDFNLKKQNIHVAFGENNKRKLFIEKYIHNIVTIISKNSYIGLDTNIGLGSCIGHKSYIGVNSIIGKGCIINTNSIIEHEVIIGDYCHIGPNSTICGKSKIGKNVFVGASSTIINNITICSDVIIGANSSVIKNIIKPGTYVGSPVKRIK